MTTVSPNALGSEFNSPDDSPGLLLWRVGNLWQQAIRHVLEPAGLTHTQFVLLASTVWLDSQKELVTQARLAVHASLDKMLVSDVTKALLNKKFLKRSANPNDSRSWLLHATPLGMQTAQQAIKLVERANREFFSRLEGKAGVFAEHLRQLAKGPGSD